MRYADKHEKESEEWKKALAKAKAKDLLSNITTVAGESDVKVCSAFGGR